MRSAIGMVKSDIEARLSIGLPNTPMQGASMRVVSGNFVTAKPRGVIEGIDFQHTGEVRRIDRAAILQQLEQRNLVLLSSCGYSPSGEMFNLSVEDVATQTAIALQADKLILMGAEEGLFDAEQGLISQLTHHDLSHQLAQGVFTGDAKRHGEAAAHAVQHGIDRVHLLSHIIDGALLQELFTHAGAGTLVTLGDYEQLRAANIDDVAAILELLTPLEQQGILVRRSREMLEMEIERFEVIEHDGRIIACAALYPYSSSMAEVACVAVNPDYRSGQRGERLLDSLSARARAQGMSRIFVLTTRTAHWFIERGFSEVDFSELPEERQSLYNFQRKSKVFMRTV